MAHLKIGFVLAKSEPLRLTPRIARLAMPGGVL